MKATILILFMLITAACITLAEAGYAGFDAKDSVVKNSLLSSGANADLMRIEDRMDEALNSLDSWNAKRVDKNFAGPNPSLLDSSPNESSAQNSSAQNLSSTNSSAQNLSSTNSSAKESSVGLLAIDGENKLNADEDQAASPTSLEESSSTGLNGVSSNSKANFKGYYGLEASRHEIGKSNIKSKIALSGSFEVDKTVKFQDQGF